MYLLHFASFVLSKREHMWNKEKCFLFYFESSFRYWDNQILNFHIFKCHDVIKCLSMKQNILLNNLGNKRSLVMKFGQFMWHCKIKLIKKLCEKCDMGISSRPFLIFKESVVKKSLRRPACWFGLISIALLLHI